MALGATISGKYDLIELLHEAGVRTYRARHRSLGREVMLHFVTAGGDESVTLLERMAQLPEAKRRLFIDAGEHAAGAFVVSWPLPEFDDLLNWLERAIRQDRPLPPAPVVRKETLSGPGEFTRAFLAGAMAPQPAAEPVRDEAAAKAAAPLPGEPGRPAELDSRQPGEFTIFFQEPTPPAAPQSTAHERLPAATPVMPGLSPDAPAARDRSPAPDEFAEFFGDRQPTPEPPPRPSPSSEPEKRGVGGLTEFFRSPVGPVVGGAARSSPPHVAAEGVLGQSEPGAGPLPAVPSLPLPGDYTKKIQTPPARPPVPAPAKPTSVVPIWVGIGLLVLLAVAIVLFFALRR